MSELFSSESESLSHLTAPAPLARHQPATRLGALDAELERLVAIHEAVGDGVAHARAQAAPLLCRNLADAAIASDAGWPGLLQSKLLLRRRLGRRGALWAGGGEH